MQKLHISAAVILFLFVFSVPAQAYNNDWIYKNPILINNSQNSNVLFDYQVLLNISYKIGMKSDFSDLRFSWLNTSSGAEVPVPYFIENYTSDLFFDVWIKVPKISANGYETIYMYYGNPSAVSESDPNATFDFYDGFEGTSLDTNKWDATGNVSVSNGEVGLYGWDTWLLSKNVFAEQITKETKSKRGDGQGMYISLRNDIDTEFIGERGGNCFHWDTSDGKTQHGSCNAPIDNYYHIWKIERNGTSFVKIYQDSALLNILNMDLPSNNLKVGFKGGEYPTGTYFYTYVDWVRIRKYADMEPTYIIGDPGIANLKTFFTVPISVQANKNFTINIKVTDNSNNPVTNISSLDIKLFRDSEQINFTDFRNYSNGTYSLNASSGNIIGNISFRIDAVGVSTESYSKVTIEPKQRSVFIAGNWEDIFSSGFVGKLAFTRYSETEKYYFGKIRPEQVFVFDNITTDYPTYRLKDMAAFFETFYSNNTAITVSSREQALAAAPYARLKNIPILFDNGDAASDGFNIILNFSAKTPEEINNIVAKEFSNSGKNINTVIITNPYSETSALAGALAAKHDSIIVPLNFSEISYPETATDFYGLNSANGVLNVKAKINQTIKRLSDNFLFSNSLDYRLGRTQINLILLGNASEVPQPAVFDSGREMFFDYDSNYLLTDFPYSDTNNDGKADLIAGRIVSPYQIIELPKTNKIVTAAIYRNLETVFSGNGLIESQTTDTAFRTAGFETVRLVENRTNLSYYELTFGFGNVTDFLKKLFEDQSITESLKLMDSVYKGYDELLEHNFYKMMSGMSPGPGGITIKMVPDERLTKDSLISQMSDADGIFYYGKGDAGSWITESFSENNIYFSEFPETSSLIYDERTNSARLPEKTIFEKGASALVGSSGIIYDTYAFMPNARFAQNMAKNKTVALSLESSRYTLLPSQIRNLSASIQFNYRPERDLAIKQFLEMVCYCDPEKKIDPDAQEQGNNPEINYSSVFTSRIKIPVNYLVSGNRIFFDAGQYLQEMGNPVVPLYSAETILPNGSRIIEITFNYNLSRHENISADFVTVYEQFNQTIEPVRGFYPSQMFYNETFDLLDGRKSVKLIAAGMQYNNGTKEALVLDAAEAVIEYSSPFEFVGFSAENITSGKNETFGISAAGENLSVVIGIRSGNFSETIEQDIPSGFSEVNWSPAFMGEFSATAYVLMGNNSAGPRYASFSVNLPETDFFKSMESFGTGGYERIMKGFSEKIRFVFNGAAAVIEYVNPFSKFSSAANSSTTEKRISSPDYSLAVFQDSGKTVYKMKSDNGELVLEKNAGATKETCRGDCSELYAKMDSKLSEMQSLQDYVIENIMNQ